MTEPGIPAPREDRLVVAPASVADWAQVEEWAAGENWNPGLRDTACFHPTDPEGFFVGRLGGRPVSAVSVVRYSEGYAFLGHYLVRPALRGRGLGLATWQAAVPHAGSRTIGLDAVPEQEATYRRSGFVAAYRSLRYGGRPPRRSAPPPPAGRLPAPLPAGRPPNAGPWSADAPAPGQPPADPSLADGVVRERGALLDRVAAYDARCFPAERRGFLGRWLAEPGHVAYVRLRGGVIRGYGVIRPARSGHRVGPLFADTPEDAGALLDALLAHADPDSDVVVDVPEGHAAARSLVEARGLVPGSYTVRMYAGEAPPTPAGRVFGGTSLELG
ncbi:GNAT family N-acetyltransferase [Streptomyces sp. NBC_01497]|uniref:GNAT family N-acetyltransferase n=1 Tax=Streptomyces sp. NBC_01497 TaxID=2903885 RepID=UPI002E30FA43|nr:GNAT family N-acetyltransferase [Streptomyces sp. NBC_01497]